MGPMVGGPGALATVAVLAAGSLVVASCSSGSGGDDAGAVDDPSAATGPATDLAPSQITAETAPPPTVPGACDPDDLALWTARVDVVGPVADAVVRVRNDGDVWCEPDVRDSPRADAAIEPDVWLDPGATADLLAGMASAGCADPAPVTEVEVDIEGTALAVPTAMVTCDWSLFAFYPNDAASGPCDPAELETAVAPPHLVVRHAGFATCELGELVDGTGVAPATGATPQIGVTELVGGDVVGYHFTVDPEVDCVTDAVDARLVFDVAGEVSVTGLPCGASFAAGPGVPWYGAAAGPAPDVAELDPFS